MKYLVLFLSLALVATALAQTLQKAAFGWNPNPETDIAGYRLYWGTISQVYPNVLDVGNVLTAQVNTLLPGKTYYFALTAYDMSGLESIPSKEIVFGTCPLGQIASISSINAGNFSNNFFIGNSTPDIQIIVAFGYWEGGIPTARTIDVEASSDLVNWTVLLTLNDIPNLQFKNRIAYDFGASSLPTRFYRLVFHY